MREQRTLRQEQGFTLIELLIVVAIIGIIAASAIPALQRALLKSRVSRIVNDAKVLEKAFLQYHTDNNLYPSTSSPPERAFNRRTLEPLVGKKYLANAPAILGTLQGKQVTAYDSPNVGGADSEYWAILTLQQLPALQIVIADTTDLPGFSGQEVSGAFFLVDGALLSLDEDVLVRLGK